MSHFMLFKFRFLIDYEWKNCNIYEKEVYKYLIQKNTKNSGLR